MRRAENGFTLLEVLVASLLLGMLVTILTMVFNQSSVAWRTGTAGVADLDQQRQQIAMWHSVADDALPHAYGSQKFVVVSPWNLNGGLRQRTVERMQSGELDSSVDFDRPESWRNISLSGSGNNSRFKSFVVGVSSDGPDMKSHTGDDITTWPKDIKK
jgi:prepilin-type N-terminal cleavage/methylation domain-containing protein